MKSLEEFMAGVGFNPNEAQLDAILHLEGPLYLPAGPGSGKTRVLLWRTFNLIVFHDVDPNAIFLSTFTQKAAKQLKDGLQTLLSFASADRTRPYEINDMYVGTIHSLCQKMLQDRRFSSTRARVRSPIILDELSQFFYLYQGKGYKDVIEPKLRVLPNPQVLWTEINRFFGKESASKYEAISGLVKFFNRISEEAPVLDDWRETFNRLGPEEGHLGYAKIFDLYQSYRSSLAGPPVRSDLSSLQEETLDYLRRCDKSSEVFKYIIIDEYQDTNAVQERIVFDLAKGSGNLCVVGDDDQALYRFRGATVENFVRFPERSEKYLGKKPNTVPLTINYRSDKDIVARYAQFMDLIDWSVVERAASYRVEKHIVAHDQGDKKRVFRNEGGSSEETIPRVLDCVQSLIERRVVSDPNQIAFLFSSLGTELVKDFKAGLEERGFRVYAPRAGGFLDTDEAKAVFGLFGQILGEYKPGFKGRDIDGFLAWLTEALAEGKRIMVEDPLAEAFVAQKRAEIEAVKCDHEALMDIVEAEAWALGSEASEATLRRMLESTKLSSACRKTLSGRAMNELLRRRKSEGRALSILYVVASATALDWTLLDLFYRFCGFKELKAIIELSKADEGPLYNLALVGRYVNTYAEEFKSMISAFDLREKHLVNSFYGSYLLTLYRRGESEFENEENPFPKGRIPFLTIHQSKGLEFPVVVLGSLKKIERGNTMDKLLEPVLTDKEPLELQPRFDAMRKFYVAMSRAQRLLIIHDCAYQVSADFKKFVESLPLLSELDFDGLEAERKAETALPKAYSFTGDFNFYRQCPMQYQIFKKFAFPPSRSQTMAFGSLVHQTLDDLHEHLIARKESHHA